MLLGAVYSRGVMEKKFRSRDSFSLTLMTAIFLLSLFSIFSLFEAFLGLRTTAKGRLFAILG